MNYKITNQNYEIFLKELNSLQDKKYQQFQQKLVPNEKIIGIRVPILRKIAKNIAHETGRDFLKIVKHDTYEECLLHGLVIGYLKEDFETTLNSLKDFLPYNHNWAVNDITVSNLKIFKKNLDLGLTFINTIINQDDWKIRFALVLLLNYYVLDKYIDVVINYSKNINSTNYYVIMANAWLISVCYIKQKAKIEPLLLSNSWNLETTKKAIQKIKDSYRVNKEDKIKLSNYLKTLNVLH